MVELGKFLFQFADLLLGLPESLVHLPQVVYLALVGLHGAITAAHTAAGDTLTAILVSEHA